MAIKRTHFIFSYGIKSFLGVGFSFLRSYLASFDKSDGNETLMASAKYSLANFVYCVLPKTVNNIYVELTILRLCEKTRELNSHEAVNYDKILFSKSNKHVLCYGWEFTHWFIAYSIILWMMNLWRSCGIKLTLKNLKGHLIEA